MITSKEFTQINRQLSEFELKIPFEEAQMFLKKLGYKIIIHEVTAVFEHVECYDNEVHPTGKFTEGPLKIVIAIKDGTILPKTEKEAKEMKFEKILNKELLIKLLDI